MANQEKDPIPTELSLSPEVWEHIFQHLSAKQLKCVRLTCRCWRDVISGSPRLMDKLPMELSPGECHGADLVGKATRVRLCSESFAMDEQWPVLGERLTHLAIFSHSIVLSEFLGMLRHTCNLKSLRFICSQFTNTDGIVVDFRLDKVERLEVNYGTTCLGVFGQVFHRLKSFELHARPDDEPDCFELNVINFVRLVQDTLEDVNFLITKYMALEISKLERLRLKNVWYRLHRNATDNSDFNIVAFCQSQTFIEELKVSFTTSINNQELSEMGRSLPGLKHLLCQINATGGMLSFTASMPELRHLEIHDDYRVVNFAKFRNANLRELSTHKMFYAPNSLQTLLEGCPNLTKLTLQDCQCKSLAELFVMLGQLKSLRYLKIRCLDMQGRETNVLRTEPLNTLTTLDVDICYLPSEVIAALYRRCTQLRKVFLRGLNINDDVLLEVCQNSPHLEELIIMTSTITDASVHAILGHCHALRYLSIHKCESLSNDTKEQLKSIEGMTIKIVE